MVPVHGLEPRTYCLQGSCYYQLSYTGYLLTLQLGHQSLCPNSLLHSLHVFIQYLYFGADDQVRTDDIGLGRTALYQLSYIRINWQRGRDSNPRNAYTFNTLAGCRFRPLSHLSIIKHTPSLSDLLHQLYCMQSVL